MVYSFCFAVLLPPHPTLVVQHWERFRTYTPREQTCNKNSSLCFRLGPTVRVGISTTIWRKKMIMWTSERAHDTEGYLWCPSLLHF